MKNCYPSSVDGAIEKEQEETSKYIYLLNSQPLIMHFAYSDWFTQSWLSAHIP